MKSATIRLVLADPHPVVLDGLRAQLQACPGVQVLACVHDGTAALEAVRQHTPDGLVLDLDLPLTDGLQVIAALQAQGSPTRPVLFTSAPLKLVMQALDLGVQGLVSKQRPYTALVDCIHQVHAGQTCLDPEITVKAMAVLMAQRKSQPLAVQLLTPREVDVARMVTEGWPNKKIASKLSISVGTAKLHLHHIYQKLNCPGRMALMLYMQQHAADDVQQPS